MNNQTRNRRFAATVAVSLLVTSGAGFAAGDNNDMNSSGSSAMAEDSMSKDTMLNDKADMKSAMLKVEDQRVSGGTVTIGDVYLPKDGYLVIHQADANGKLKAPESIGHMLVSKGEHENVKIKLNRPVKSGDKLFAMLHNDTDEHGKFRFAESGGKKDGAMKADSKPVIESFMVK